MALTKRMCLVAAWHRAVLEVEAARGLVSPSSTSHSDSGERMNKSLLFDSEGPRPKHDI